MMSNRAETGMHLNKELSLLGQQKVTSPSVVSEEELNKEALIVAQVKIDAAYFKILYEKYFDAIFFFVIHRIKDSNNASDLTSQVFLKALLKINTYEARGIPFSAWLYKIALNEINQFFRKEKRSKTVIIDDQALHSISSEMEDQNLAYKKEKLEQTLQTLSPKEVDLLELRFQVGLSYKEIANIVDCSEINARVKVHRVIDKIKFKWGLK